MIPALGRWRQEEQKFKTPFGYIASVRSASPWDLVSKTQNTTKFPSWHYQFRDKKKSFFHILANCSSVVRTTVLSCSMLTHNFYHSKKTSSTPLYWWPLCRIIFLQCNTRRLRLDESDVQSTQVYKQQTDPEPRKCVGSPCSRSPSALVTSYSSTALTSLWGTLHGRTEGEERGSKGNGILFMKAASGALVYFRVTAVFLMVLGTEPRASGMVDKPTSKKQATSPAH